MGQEIMTWDKLWEQDMGTGGMKGKRGVWDGVKAAKVDGDTVRDDRR